MPNLPLWKSGQPKTHGVWIAAVGRLQSGGIFKQKSLGPMAGTKEEKKFSHECDWFLVESVKQERDLRSTVTGFAARFTRTNKPSGRLNVNNVVKFDSHFNIREDLYKSFLSTVSDPEMWSSKLICEQIYKILPECKPPPGKRPRYKQQAIMYIPTMERVLNALNASNCSNYNTENVRF